MRLAKYLLMCAVLIGLLLSFCCCCFGGLDDEEFDNFNFQDFSHNEGSGGDA